MKKLWKKIKMLFTKKHKDIKKTEIKNKVSEAKNTQYRSKIHVMTPEMEAKIELYRENYDGGYMP